MSVYTDALPSNYDTWEKVKKDFKAAFGDVNLELSAMIQLEALCAVIDFSKYTSQICQNMLYT